jgi:anti-anti-sigma factor
VEFEEHSEDHKCEEEINTECTKVGAQSRGKTTAEDAMQGWENEVQSGHGWRRVDMAANDGVSSARGFRVHRREVEDGWVVECFGRLTSENVPLLKMEMLAACGKKGCIVLDLKEVPMMDSSGLGAVVTLYVSARTRGCKLEVVNASRQIRELFSMTKVLGLFEDTGRHGRRMM